MTDNEVYEFWMAAKKINPDITLAQAAALARRLLTAKKAAKRRGPQQ